MIKVKNISSSNVTLICAPLRFRRPLTPSREIALTREIYDELSFDPGFQTMVEIGILKVSGAEEENAAVIESSMITLSREEIKKMFDDKDYTGFAKAIQDASPATKESIIAIAVEMRIADKGFASLIDKYCNTNVLDAIANQAD